MPSTSAGPPPISVPSASRRRLTSVLVTSSPERSISIITTMTLDGAGKKRVSMK